MNRCSRYKHTKTSQNIFQTHQFKIKNQEFNSIMAKKGRIHRELRCSWGVLQIWTKSDEELRWEIRHFSIFSKKTLRWIHEIKNHSICIKTCREIKEKKLDRISFLRREKTKIKYKINLIYGSKLIDNDIGRKIRRKTHNLTWIHPWNDLLMVGSRAFHSKILKTKFGIQEKIYLYSFDKILISSTPWT